MSAEKSLNPYNVVCVCKHDGKEVGRIAASATNATAYIDALTRQYGGLSIEYVTDATEAMISRAVNSQSKN